MSPRNPHGALNFDTPDPLPMPDLSSMTSVTYGEADGGPTDVTARFTDRIEAVAYANWLIERQAVAS